jgi:hypothetical protein
LAYHSPIKLDEITQTCERLYQRDGFVKWAEVAKAFGLSRQAISARLSQAVKNGKISEEDYERWRSMSSRITQSRYKEEIRRENAKLNISVTLTPDNKKWLSTESVVTQSSTSDLINGLINKARTGRTELKCD